MITMERTNVVRQVATDEQAEVLRAAGFVRKGGEAEVGTATGVDLAEFGATLLGQLQEQVRDEVAKATQKPPKAEKGKKEAEPDGAGADSPDSGGGTQ